MDENQIKNFTELATTPNRKMALQIMEAGLKSINTENVVFNSVKLENNILSVAGKNFDLNNFKKIKVVGFGKSSCEAAMALEKILGSKINEGAVIGLNKVSCDIIETFAGTHPKPSPLNIEAGKKIYDMVNQSNETDLIIVIVSGGGSALLCPTQGECNQEVKLYDSFLASGQTIKQINTVRKHLSLLKGGGLAKIAYPATVIGLIFSDVPGDNFKDVASGPTYKDETTVADAEKIIAENNLGQFNLVETPKEDKYFEKVHNFVLVGNITAVEAMAKKSEELGLEAKIVSTELYDEVDEALKKIFSGLGENETQKGFSRVLGSPGPYPGQTTPKPFLGSVFLAAGEPSVVVPKNAGKGGRNLHIGLEAIKNKMINDDVVFISFASDGMDNSDVSGAVIDKYTIEKAEKLNLNANDYADRFDSYDFFQKTGDLIFTGPTGANVSDLMILLTKK